MYFSHSNLFLSTAPLDINPFNTRLIWFNSILDSAATLALTAAARGSMLFLSVTRLEVIEAALKPSRSSSLRHLA